MIDLFMDTSTEKLNETLDYLEYILCNAFNDDISEAKNVSGLSIKFEDVPVSIPKDHIWWF